MKILKVHSKSTVIEMVKSIAADYIKKGGQFTEEGETILLASDVDIPGIEENAQVTVTILPVRKGSRRFIPERGMVDVVEEVKKPAPKKK